MKAALLSAAILLVVLGWPSGQPARLVQQVPSAVTAQPLLPAAPGAVVPAPWILVHGGPTAIGCPALQGSLAFGADRVGMLRLTSSAGSVCRLPGMLDRLRLLDRAGAVRGRGLDPRTRYPTNPPSLAPVALPPGQTATMYLRPASGRGCTGRIVRAEFTIGSATIAVPLTGSPGCANYWYGPFSTSTARVALPPPSWNALTPTLDFPAVMHRNSPTAFHVTLTNHGGEAVEFRQCPEFGIVLAGAHQVLSGNGTVTCPRPVKPGASIRLTMSYAAELPPGAYSVRWAIAGVPAASANTTITR